MTKRIITYNIRILDLLTLVISIRKYSTKVVLHTTGKGFNFGIDFSGGVAMDVKAISEDVNIFVDLVWGMNTR